MFHWLLACFRPDERARQLGMAMLADPVIRPYLRHVQQYPDYQRFLLAHRAHWEESQQFAQHYEQAIYRLAERLIAGNGLDKGTTLEWDAKCSRAAHHLKHIMWSTWEQRVGLEAMYTDTRWKALTKAGPVRPVPEQPPVASTIQPATAPAAAPPAATA